MTLMAVDGEALSIAAGTKNGGSKGSGRIKMMHDQLLLGVRHVGLSWHTPKKSLSLPVHPYNPPGSS